jgi:hypothetical protein
MVTVNSCTSTRAIPVQHKACDAHVVLSAKLNLCLCSSHKQASRFRCNTMYNYKHMCSDSCSTVPAGQRKQLP